MGENERDETRGGEAEDSEVKITDRRLFTSDGSLRRQLDAEEAEEQREAAERRPASTEASANGAKTGFERRSLDEPPGVDFTMLINAMAQPALIFLGEIEHPGTGRKEFNLEQARVQIDMLEVLRIKCRGNLTSEEEGLLDRVLYELRMRYVSRSGQPGG